MKTYVYFLSRQNKFNRKHLCATYRNFVLLTVTFSSEIHTERIVALQLQQWLQERATLLRHTTLSSLFIIFVNLLYTEEGSRNPDTYLQKYTVCIQNRKRSL
jgi:hypothetical protein